MPGTERTQDLEKSQMQYLPRTAAHTALWAVLNMYAECAHWAHSVYILSHILTNFNALKPRTLKKFSYIPHPKYLKVEILKIPLHDIMCSQICVCEWPKTKMILISHNGKCIQAQNCTIAVLETPWVYRLMSYAGPVQPTNTFSRLDKSRKIYLKFKKNTFQNKYI